MSGVQIPLGAPFFEGKNLYTRDYGVGWLSPTSITVRAIVTYQGKSWWSDMVFPMSYEEFAKAMNLANSKNLPLDVAFPQATDAQINHLLYAGKFQHFQREN